MGYPPPRAIPGRVASLGPAFILVHNMPVSEVGSTWTQPNSRSAVEYGQPFAGGLGELGHASLDATMQDALEPCAGGGVESVVLH